VAANAEVRLVASVAATMLAYLRPVSRTPVRRVGTRAAVVAVHAPVDGPPVAALTLGARFGGLLRMDDRPVRGLVSFGSGLLRVAHGAAVLGRVAIVAAKAGCIFSTVTCARCGILRSPLGDTLRKSLWHTRQASLVGVGKRFGVRERKTNDR
jgi:hypothetical protein